MKISGGLVLLFLLSVNISYADINPYGIDDAIVEDNSGFYYRGSVDYRPQVPKEEPGVGYSILSASRGCSGFDFASSFQNLFSEQIISDYLKDISSSAIAAAPMLLLEYASPTLADIVKHFNATTNMRLGLRYAQCEDIEKAAGEYMDKLRKKSESECIKEKVARGIDIDRAMRECKEGNDPFAFLKDAKGAPLFQGGKIDILSDVFKKINIPEERKEFAKAIVGETTVTSTQIESNKGAKSLYSVNEEFRSENFGKLVSLLDEYLKSKTISEERLKELSLPNNPLTEEQIRNIALMPKAKQYIALAKIASDLAYFKTLDKCQQAREDLLEAMRQPGIDDVQREVLQRDYNYLKERLGRFQEERQLYRNYNEAVAGVLSEAEKEKLRMLINEDGTTSYFSDAAQTQDKKEMYLPSSPGKEGE